MDPICDASHGSFRTWSEYNWDVAVKMNFAGFVWIVTWNWNDSIGIRELAHFWAVPVIPLDFRSNVSTIEYLIDNLIIDELKLLPK